MIYVSNEFKQAFLSAEQKKLLLNFDDGTIIDNEDIAMESMELEQTLCDSDELKFGKIASACFKVKISVSTKKYKNLWFNAKISVGEHDIALGRFKVYTDNMTSDRLYREIVAYDALFWAINTDVTEWYNKLTFPITQKAFRNSLFTHLGIEQETVSLPNDSITFNRTADVENLTGLTVLQKLCEINATWGTINNMGKFKYVRMRTHEHDALYPSNDLYPSDDLYPNDIYDDRLSRASYFQGSLKYEEYDTQPITKVTIREDKEDLGYSYGTDGNTYVIENNFLIYGATNQVLKQVAKNFYDYAQYIAYTPSELKCKGAPWREVGDLLFVVADKRTLTVPILNRKLSGITALNDTYIAKGTETYGEVKNSPTEQIKQLQGRTNKLTRTLDETKSELQEFQTDTNGQLTAMSSSITQTSKSITAEVTRATKAEGELSSKITQTANSITTKVSKGEVISEINQTAGVIEFKADRKITVDSPNWKVDGNGTQTCNNISITGGEISLTGDSTTPKLTINHTNGSKGQYFPLGFRVYDTLGRDILTALSFSGFIHRQYSSDGSVLSAGLSATGISTSGSMSAQRISLNGSGTYSETLYVNGNAKILGTTTLGSSPVIGSDRELKKEISELDKNESSDFIYSLKPCKFKYKDGTSDRFHHGLIAQEVKDSMGEDDWGIYIENKETKEKGVRYEELIADLIATVQIQNERIKVLEERLGV